MCSHHALLGEMCMQCRMILDDKFSVKNGYIHKNLRLAKDEISLLREKDFKIMLRQKKLYLVLDLDHTLLNSTRYNDITKGEGHLQGQRDTLPDALKSSLFSLDSICTMTKLRPFVNTFLKEASKLFKMYIYTMGERVYALKMAKLLDPDYTYFKSRVIARGDCNLSDRKGLDVILGKKSATLILDDTQTVWKENKENLILMERYHFFASSCKQFGLNSNSLAELRIDESETEGALATVLKVLQRIHSLFFGLEHEDNLESQDVRLLLKTVRQEVLKGCEVIFSSDIANTFKDEHQRLLEMAEQLGARCSTELDSSVTHVVSINAGTHESYWAMQENKFLVHPGWIEAAKYTWQKQPEENFRVSLSQK
ncbi:RNA polymerase II C-terminal domain phosphatase-like 4 [Olea europaea subsp. europaea]|nr:RNA polymerase II C-terminal domain phosphatase-like 4 [Olea europaea subsp. europaea]